jgi:serine/threonine protein kinase
MILILENLQPKFYLNLSLENIYVRANGYLMLDGLQKIKEGKVKEDEKVYYKLEGNAYYFAPEMITFQGYSSESVVWKLGICAYYLFKGRYPFEGKNLKELYYNILTKDLEEDPDVPEYIVKMLIKDKKKRITLE